MSDKPRYFWGDVELHNISGVTVSADSWIDTRDDGMIHVVLHELESPYDDPPIPAILDAGDE